MVGPIKILNSKGAVEQLVSELRHGLELAESLDNVDDRVACLKGFIDTEQQRLAELDVEMRELRREARRQGIPPGWLRG